MSDNVFHLHAVEPPAEGIPLAEQLRVLANAIERAASPVQNIIVITVGEADGLMMIGNSVLGGTLHPLATIGALEATKRAMLG